MHNQVTDRDLGAPLGALCAPGPAVRAIFSSLPIVYTQVDRSHAIESHLCFTVKQLRFHQSDFQESVLMGKETTRAQGPGGAACVQVPELEAPAQQRVTQHLILAGHGKADSACLSAYGKLALPFSENL